MYPGMLSWWKHAHSRRGCGTHAQWGAPGHLGGFETRYAGGGFDEDLGGSFGVRRPLRFLAYKLELDESQMSELARILDELKTERAQAAVDQRRTLSAFADAVTADQFDATKAGEGAALRTQAAQRLRDAVVKALGRIHALLNAEQREKLAYLIRTGTLAL